MRYKVLIPDKEIGGMEYSKWVATGVYYNYSKEKVRRNCKHYNITIDHAIATYPCLQLIKKFRNAIVITIINEGEYYQYIILKSAQISWIDKLKIKKMDADLIRRGYNLYFHP